MTEEPKTDDDDDHMTLDERMAWLRERVRRRDRLSARASAVGRVWNIVSKIFLECRL